MKFAILCVLGTIVCWGLYGPMIHEGQVAMQNAAVRAFFLVGMAYFFLAVVVCGGILAIKGDVGAFNTKGVSISLIAGVLGALGALGVIFAMKFGGKPIWVMPLVFGGAPLVNVAYSVLRHPPKNPPSPMLYVGFLMALAGAAMVLRFKPV